MSRLFDDAQSEYLYIDQAVRTAVPFAMACKFYSNDTSINHILISICDKDTDDNTMRLQLGIAGAGNKVGAAAWNNPNWGSALTSAAYTVNTWQHACAIFVSATDRRSFLEGANKGTNADNVTPANLDSTWIGIDGRSTPYGPTSGMIAEAAIWDLSAWPGATASLKADGFEKILPILVKGFTPLHFPLGLVAYWPLIRGLNDKVGGYNLTASGTTVVAHPRIIQPCGVL